MNRLVLHVLMDDRAGIDAFWVHPPEVHALEVARKLSRWRSVVSVSLVLYGDTRTIEWEWKRARRRS